MILSPQVNPMSNRVISGLVKVCIEQGGWLHIGQLIFSACLQGWHHLARTAATSWFLERVLEGL